MRSFIQLIFTPLLAVAVCTCGSDSPTSGGPDASVNQKLRGQVLANLGENVIVPELLAFESSARELRDELSQEGSVETVRPLAQSAWREAMRDWQHVEQMQVGPIGAMDTTSGGEDMRDEIYFWPPVNLCGIDQRVASDDYQNPEVLAEDLVNVRGLGAIEYLLFVESADNKCSPLSSINADGTWAAFSSEQIEQRRMAMAAQLAELVHLRASELVVRWSKDGGNFVQELTDPARPGALYGSAQEGLNAVSDAMFYLYESVRDMKLGKPAGIVECTETTCPDLVEFPHSGYSVQAIRENLLAFQSLYRGGDESSELGFDDLLIAMDASEFARTMDGHIDAAIAAVDQIDGPLHEAVISDAADVEAAYAAIRVVVADLKTMFVSVLDLEIPNRVATDND